jgi:hypothetical protein
MDTRRDNLTCEQARARIPQHARGTLQAEEVALLRAHFEGCEDCSEQYREAIEATVQLGKAAIDEVEESDVRRRATRARTQEGMRGARSFRWRTILLPLFFAWLIIEISGVFSQAPRIVLVEAQGAVYVAERSVESYEEFSDENALLLVRSSWCEIGEGGSASFELPGGRFTLTGPAALLAEGVDPPRLHLKYGSFAFETDGDLTLITQRGSLKLEEGKAVVLAGPEAVEIDWIHGAGVFQDASGEAPLEAGVLLRR